LSEIKGNKMSCIVGLVDEENTVWMGGDSAGVSGYDLRIRKDEKVFNIYPFIIGHTSSFRMGQILRYKLSPSDKLGSMGDYKYMCTLFIDEVRSRLKENGYMKIKDNEESGGEFLAGYNGKLYQIDSDFQVGECADGFDAIGCGANYALGSLHSTEYMTYAKERIEQALEAAQRFSAGVREPFVIRKLEK
jgi:hypothetical protein